MLRIPGLLILLLLFSNILLFAQNTNVCEEMSHDFEVGAYFAVTLGDANNLRSEPNADAELIGLIPPGETFVLLEGHYCDENFLWLHLRFQNLVGWTVAASWQTNDFYIEAASAPSVDTRSSAGTIEVRQLSINNGLIDASIDITIPAQLQTGVISATETFYPAINSNNPANPSETALPPYIEIAFFTDTQRYTLKIISAHAYEAYFPERNIFERVDIIPGNLLEAINNYPVGKIDGFDTAWGGIYREVRQFNVGDFNPDSDAYTYIALGESSDGNLLLVLSVSVSINPPESVTVYPRNANWANSSIDLERANYQADIQRSLLAMEEYLGTVADDAFFPSLTALDAMLMNLNIDSIDMTYLEAIPEGFFPTPQLSPTPDYGAEIPPNDIYVCDPEVPLGFSSGVLIQNWIYGNPVRVRLEPAGEYAGFDVPPGEVVVAEGISCAELNGEMIAWRYIVMVDGRSGWVAQGQNGGLFFNLWVWDNWDNFEP
jgi:hypothetical protein